MSQRVQSCWKLTYVFVSMGTNPLLSLFLLWPYHIKSIARLKLHQSWQLAVILHCRKIHSCCNYKASVLGSPNNFLLPHSSMFSYLVSLHTISIMAELIYIPLILTFSTFSPAFVVFWGFDNSRFDWDEMMGRWGLTSVSLTISKQNIFSSIWPFVYPLLRNAYSYHMPIFNWISFCC